MNHERQAELVRSIAGQPERRPGIGSDHLMAKTDLDPDNEVRVLARPGDRLLRRCPADVLQLADEAADHALDGDVEERKYPGAGRPDDKTVQRRKRLGPRRSRVDRRRHPPAKAVRVRLYAVMRNAGEQVRVEVDEARGNQQACRVDPLPVVGFAAAPRVGVDAGDEAVADADSCHRVDSPARVEYPAADDVQAVHTSPSDCKWLSATVNARTVSSTSRSP